MGKLEGDRKAGSGRYIVIGSRFNGWITERLSEGAVAKLKELGCAEKDVDVAWVPGSFELPLAARAAASSGRFRGVVCVGAVIRGETTHHKHVASGCVAGLQEVMQSTGIPVGFGVITADDMGQAEARARAGGGRNLGADAAAAAVEMASLVEKLRKAG